MQFEPWMEKVSHKDMPNEDLRYIAEKAGIKHALMLIFLLAGLSIYIPKNSLKKLKETYVINEYDGSRFTINRLAIECNLSQRQIYRIISNHLKKQKRLNKTS